MTQATSPRIEAVNNSFLRLATAVVDHLAGKAVLKLSFWHYYPLVKDLRPFTMYLENQLFPNLREFSQNTLILKPHKVIDTMQLSGFSGNNSYQFNNCSAFANWMQTHGIKEIHLATNLEFGQMIETFLLLFFAKECPWYSKWMKKIAPQWSGEALYQAMSAGGLNKFCALIKLQKSASVYKIHYYYCELFFSKTVRGYLNTHSKYKDHRVLEAVTPRVTFAAFISMLLPFVLIPWFPVAAVILGAFNLIWISLLIWYLIKTMASLQYDREHYESLTNEYVQKTSILSRFPEADPQPIFRFHLTGELLYMNSSAQALLQETGLTSDEYSHILPQNYLEIIAQCSSKNSVVDNVEVEIGAKYIQYLFTPYPGLKSVIVHGHDITALKSKERLLRNISHNLSELVKARTQKIERTRDVTILSLAKLAEIRDTETGAHLERTQEYVKVLAIQLKQDSKYSNLLGDRIIKKIYKSTPLHDIGKVGVPDSILLKPGKLTAEEFDDMKKHTLYGGEALKEADSILGYDSFLRIARDIAYHHHERWDGTGYPFGKAGEDIPLAARLMAVADVYDALVSRRPYKEPFPHQKAREIILEGKGSHFDPIIIDAFEQVEEQFKTIAKEHEEAITVLAS